MYSVLKDIRQRSLKGIALRWYWVVRLCKVRWNRLVLNLAKVLARPILRGYHYLVRTSLAVLALSWLAVLCPLPVHAQSTRGASLTLRVAPECSIGIVSVLPGSPNGQIVTFNYKLRTAGAGGNGQITLRFTTASPANYSAESTVEYQTTLTGPGTPSSSTIPTASALNSGIVIAQFGSQAHSSREGAIGTVQFTIAPPPEPPFGPLRPSFSMSCQ
jgi:hypothetical protein